MTVRSSAGHAEALGAECFQIPGGHGITQAAQAWKASPAVNPLIAAAMAACLQHMSGGIYEKDFQDCDKITVEYNMEVESLTQTPTVISQYHEQRSRQDDAATVARAAAMLPMR